MERKQLYHLNREDSNTSANFDLFSQSDERKPVRKLITPSSSLEIVEGDLFEGASGFVYERSSSEASSRPWSRSSAGSVPPRNDSSLSRRTLTPTKQVSLQAVRRREERSDPFVDHIAVGNLQREGSDRSLWDNSVHDDDIDFSKLSFGDFSFRQNQKNKSFVNGTSSSFTGNTPKDNQASSQGKEGTNVQNKENKNEDSSSDDDDDNNDEDKDTNEKLKAPTELLMEFIDCLMKKDFPNASKLCKMILLYEPENEEALKFQPLIEEKMLLDAAAEEEDGSSGDEDDDDEDDSDDSDDSDSEEDSSSEEEDSDDTATEDVTSQPLNSGTASGQGSTDPRITGANAKRVWKPAN